MTFTMWSFGHFLFIASPIILAIGLHYLTKRHSFDAKRRIGIIMMGFAVVLLLLRNLEIWINKDFALHFEIIPLQICHLANFVLLLAFIKKDRTLFALPLHSTFPPLTRPSCSRTVWRIIPHF